VGIVALVPAAGFGTRFHESGPKALVRLCGRPLLLHALERLAASGLIDRAVVSCPVGFVASFEEALGGFSLPVTVVEGGSSRKDSVQSAFKGSELPDDDLICIHDAARPLVDPSEVAAVIQAAEKTGAAVACYSTVETMKQVANGRVLKTVPRNELVAASTPQVFRVSLFRAAIEKDSRHEVTDDAELLERMGVPVAVVLTSRWNIKITYQEDLTWAEAFLRHGASAGAPT
jgi:2-C-methyl-D-erythritol 4-phosphate cytidylyltransferase